MRRFQTLTLTKALSKDHHQTSWLLLRPGTGRAPFGIATQFVPRWQGWMSCDMHRSPQTRSALVVNAEYPIVQSSNSASQAVKLCLSCGVVPACRLVRADVGFQKSMSSDKLARCLARCFGSSWTPHGKKPISPGLVCYIEISAKQQTPFAASLGPVQRQNPHASVKLWLFWLRASVSNFFKYDRSLESHTLSEPYKRPLKLLPGQPKVCQGF